MAARDEKLPLMFSGVHRHFKTPIQSVFLYVRYIYTIQYTCSIFAARYRDF